MSSNVIELDNTDQYLIYQQLEKQPFPNRKPQAQSKNQHEKFVICKERKQIPSKIVLRPVIIKFIDRILSLYLQQKTPHQIQLILKEPTLPQIQFILKQKIQTFLNIIFESSNCYTEEQIQKRKSQIDKKIQRISTELLDPLAKNFLDTTKFINFLKLMKYHKEGRRSEKISKQSNSFFRLFFLKMKFEGIPHTQGNVIELNESLSKSKNKFDRKNDADFDDSQYGGYSSSKQSKNLKNPSFKVSSVSKGKKYSYPKQLIVNEKMMDEVTQEILTEIRSKATVPDKNNENPAQKSSNKNSQSIQPRNCIDIEKNQQQDIQWTFDKQISLVYQLFQSYDKKQGISKSIRHIYKLFFMKYPKISESQLNFQSIYLKIQSMYSVSCQKFVRRVKFLTIKEGLQIETQKKNMDKDKNLQSQLASMQKNRKLYSILEIEKHIEEQTDKKYLTKEEQFYFTKLKEKLKMLDAKPVYFSAFIGAKCVKEWKFMLDMIREFYFSTLEDIRFEYLLKMVQKLNQITINNKDRNLSYLSLPNQDEEKSSQSSQKKDTIKQTQKYLDQMLPKFSLSSTLRKIGKSNQMSNHQKTTVNEQRKSQIQKKIQERFRISETRDLNELINKSVGKKSSEMVQNSTLKSMNSNLANSRLAQNGLRTQNKQLRHGNLGKSDRGEIFQSEKAINQKGMMKEEICVIKIEEEKIQTVNIKKNENPKKNHPVIQKFHSPNFIDKKIVTDDFPKPSKRRFDETNLENSILQTSKQNTAKRIKPNQKVTFQDKKDVFKIDSRTNKNEIQRQIVSLDDDQNEDEFDQVLELSDQFVTQNDIRINKESGLSVDKKGKESQSSKFKSFQHNQSSEQVKSEENVPKARRTVQKVIFGKSPFQQNKLLKSHHKISPSHQQQENLYIDEEESPDKQNDREQYNMQIEQGKEDDMQQIKLKKAMQDIMEQVEQQAFSQQQSQRTKKGPYQQQDFDMQLIQQQDASLNVSIQKSKKSRQNPRHKSKNLQLEDQYSIYEMEQYLQKIGRQMFNNDLQDDCTNQMKKHDSGSASKDQQNNDDLDQMGELDQKQEWQIIQRELLKIKSMQDSILNQQQGQINETQTEKKQNSKIKRTGPTKTSKQLQLLLRDSIKFPNNKR